MSDYLHNLTARHVRSLEVMRPWLGSAYEPQSVQFVGRPGDVDPGWSMETLTPVSSVTPFMRAAGVERVDRAEPAAAEPPTTRDEGPEFPLRPGPSGAQDHAASQLESASDLEHGAAVPKHRVDGVEKRETPITGAAHANVVRAETRPHTLGPLGPPTSKHQPTEADDLTSIVAAEGEGPTSTRTSTSIESSTSSVPPSPSEAQLRPALPPVSASGFEHGSAVPRTGTEVGVEELATTITVRDRKSEGRAETPARTSRAAQRSPTHESTRPAPQHGPAELDLTPIDIVGRLRGTSHESTAKVPVRREGSQRLVPADVDSAVTMTARQAIADMDAALGEPLPIPVHAAPTVDPSQSVRVTGHDNSQAAVERHTIAALPPTLTPAETWTRPTPSSEPPSIKVTIGQVDVRAVTPPSAALSKPRPRPRPALSLDDYLKQRSGGRR